MEPHHSFELEHDLALVFAAAGLVKHHKVDAERHGAGDGGEDGGADGGRDGTFHTTLLLCVKTRFN